MTFELVLGTVNPTSVFYYLAILDATFDHKFTHPTIQPGIILNNLDQISISKKCSGQYIHGEGVTLLPENLQLFKVESKEFYLSFLDNKHGKLYYKNGAIYEGNIFHQTQNLKGKITFPNGEFYEGEWELGLKHGYGKYYWKKGDFYEGEWAVDCMSGKGILTFSDGRRIEGNWADGSLESEKEIENKFFDGEGNEVKKEEFEGIGN